MQDKQYGPTFIVIEGVDRTGKTTLQHSLNKFFNFKYIVIDRSHLSHIVYNKIFKRGVDEKYYKEIETKFREMDTILIYLFAEPDTIFARLNQEENHEEIDIIKHLKVYRKYYNKCTLKKISINTSMCSINEVFELAKNFIKTYEKQ